MDKSLYLIAGLGKTGLSIARYLERRNKPFVFFDTRPKPPELDTFKKVYPKVEVYLEQVPLAIFTRLKAVIASPGIPLEIPLLRDAMTDSIPVYGDIECLAREIKAPVIAITGTNGKSTVTALAGEMARAAGFKTAVGGNIGEPVLDLLDDDQQYDLFVLELSSFQLDLTHSLAPTAATILNISPDHLDRHHTVESYIQAKQWIYHNAKAGVFNRQDSCTFPPNVKDTLALFSFGEDTPREGQWGLLKQGGDIFLAHGKQPFLSVQELRIKGVHNWQNALAACALATLAGVPREAQINALKAFPGLPHRCQWVRTINEVDWINDSKGTNVGASISAITGIGSSLSGKIVLIAGGQGKGADFSLLADAVKEQVRSLVLIGEDADKIAQALAHLVPVEKAQSLEAAVQLAQTKAQKGDVVLLSPACASLDMFKDFNHRGERFTALVNAL